MGTNPATLEQEPRNPTGRPTSFRMEMVPKARQLAKIGATHREIAEMLEISPPTLYEWIAKYKVFSNALKQGERAQTKRVKHALYTRAVGYSQTSEKVTSFAGISSVTPYVEHIAPDVNAIKFWLTNKAPQEWQDRTTTELAGSVTLVAQALSTARQRVLSAKNATPTLKGNLEPSEE